MAVAGGIVNNLRALANRLGAKASRERSAFADATLVGFLL